MRASYNGITPDFQSDDRSSILRARSIDARSQDLILDAIQSRTNIRMSAALLSSPPEGGSGTKRGFDSQDQSH